MAEDKSSLIKKSIKEAKAKKIKVHEYLSGGNSEYESAIKAIRLTGVFATIPAAFYLLVVLGTIFLATFVLAPVSQKTNGADATNAASPLLGVTVVFYLILSIIQFVFCYRLRNLSKPPRSIKAYLIFTLINSILPTALALLSGQIALPGVLPLLAFIYSIISLSNFKNYTEWYDHFDSPIKKKLNKRKTGADIKNNEHKEKDGHNSSDPSTNNETGDGEDELL